MALEKLQINFNNVLKEEDVKNFLQRARKLGYDSFMYKNIDDDANYLYNILNDHYNRKVVVWESGDISYGGLDGIKAVSLDDFLNDTKTYKVTKRVYDLIQEIKEHDLNSEDSLPLYSLTSGVSHEAASELAKIIDDKLDPIVLRYILGDESITFEIEEEKWVLVARDKDDDQAFFSIENGLPTFVYSKNDATVFNSKKDAELKRPSDDFHLVKL